MQGRETVINGVNSNSTGRLPFSIPRPVNVQNAERNSMHNGNRSSSEQQVHAEKLPNEQVQYIASNSLSSLSPRVSSSLANAQRSRSSPLRSVSHDGTTRHAGFAYGAPPGYNATDMDGAIYASTSDVPLSPSMKLRQQQIMRTSPIAIPNQRGTSSSPMGSPHTPHRHSPLGSPLRMQSPSGSPIRGHSPLSSPLLRNRSPRNSPPRIMSPLSSPQRRLHQQASSYPPDQPPPLPTRLKPNVPERTSSLPRTNVLGSGHGQLLHPGLRDTARYVNIEDAEKQFQSTLPNGHIVNSNGSSPCVSTGSQTPPSSPLHKSKLPLSNYAINNNNNNQTPPNGSPTTQPKLPVKRLSRPMSATLESLIVAKLEAEHIDLTFPPYSNQVRTHSLFRAGKRRQKERKKTSA